MSKKWESIAVLVLLLAVGYLLFRNFKELAMPDTKAIGNPGVLQLEAPKRARILAQTLTVKSEPKQLPEGKTVFGELRVTAPSGNSGDIYLADTPASCSTGPRFTVIAGQTEPIKVSNISRLYYSGTLNDTLSIYAEVESAGG